nr:5-methylcytosine-specific restriction endonuclease system specificity protein McrC [uncultured Deefgea sp.]
MAAKIPLRNIWILFLYAADLVKFKGVCTVEIESARDLPELLARLLVKVVEQRLRRNLSRGYQDRRAVLSRVRGRIDVLATEAGQLLERGRVACHFQEHTMDTPRNRLVRAALEHLARNVVNAEIAHQCRSMSRILEGQGVSNQKPSRSDLAVDQVGRNESADSLMVGLAKMVFESCIPTQQSGHSNAVDVDADEYLVRRLFEKAVANALKIQLQPLGWQVMHGRKLSWPVTGFSDGIMSYLPGMQTDIELVNVRQKRKLVIDTKFTRIFAEGCFKSEMLRSGYLYQLYAYLRTQTEQTDVHAIERSEGMLLHPQCGEAFDGYVDIQGHRMRFKTIDLMSSAEEFENQLLSIVSNA